MNNNNTNNPNNDAYWKTKGYDSKPANWNELILQKSKRQLNREKYHSNWDGGYTEPLCKDDY